LGLFFSNSSIRTALLQLKGIKGIKITLQIVLLQFILGIVPGLLIQLTIHPRNKDRPETGRSFNMPITTDPAAIAE
jgi:hypothetical protein